jgi:pimeloyl-ACP methyl ester carboxylesterase
VYDFEGDPSATAGDGPHRALLLLEVPRLAGELASSFAIDLVAPKRPRGEGRPVLVIPGFQATDGMTGRLRSHLRHHGFRVHGWAQGANIGLTDARIDGLVARFEELRKEYDEPVSVVGWSFGGVLARWLAHTYPGDVRQIVCLGSPWRAEGERTRATAMFERSRRKHGISERAKPMVELLRGPVPVPCTAVYSKTDGIVPWRGCAVDTATRPPADNVVVPSSHVGMVANPLVLDVVVDRLCQDPADWQTFTWRSALARKWVPA